MVRAFDFDAYRAAFRGQGRRALGRRSTPRTPIGSSTATATRLGDGRRIIEHVIADVRDGRIVRHVDVEAWD